MATKITNSNALSLGTFAAQAVVTHVRYQIGSTVLATDALSASVTVPINNELTIPANGIDVRFEKGDGEDAAVKAAWEAYLTAQNGLTVRAMTSATVEVAVSGYAAVTVPEASITYTTVAD